uniref:Uncharacterized protein n=1 Tax=Schizaphis graminum TaxID=13262 RepID=A0A2S2NVD9_SCHGA
MMIMHKSSSFILVIATLACCTSWRSVQCYSEGMLEELQEIEVFVRSVLAVAKPYNLGIPDKLPARANAFTITADGPLPDDMQRYLKGLLAVSSAVDRRTLVEMLLDDTLIVDEDQESHSVFDRVHGGRKPESRVKKPIVRMPKKT